MHDIVELITNKLKELKAKDIRIFNLKNVGFLFDNAIIATGNSSRHVIILADKLSDLLKQKYNIFTRSEGYQLGEWILMDTGNIIINIFQEEARNKYKLEEIWNNHSSC